jgi:hypothetical protein
MKNMRTEEEVKTLRSWLLENGWSTRIPIPPMETCSQVWAKVLPGAQCTTGEAGGAPVEVRIYDNSPPLDVEISIRAQKPDGVWVDFTYYALPGGDLTEQVEAQVASLVKAWNIAAGKTLPVFK